MMTSSFWARTWATEQPWSAGSVLIATLNPGQTLQRVHFGVRATAITANDQNMLALAQDFLAVGVVTVNTSAGHAVPNALTGGTDVAPPLERWIWWGAMGMRPATFGAEHPDVCMWTSDTTVENASTQGQVKANVPAGQTLQAFISFAPWTSTGFVARGNVSVQMWASCLIRVP